MSFDNKESDILIVKNLSRAPATPLTGTYDCTNCAAAGVGFPNGRTWNVMSIGEGNNQNFAVQIAYGNRVYTSAAENNMQTGCQTFSFAPNFTLCGVSGSAQILGFSLTFTGTHVYNNLPSESCSSVEGTWSAPGYGTGGTNGTFTSDSATEGGCF